MGKAGSTPPEIILLPESGAESGAASASASVAGRTAEEFRWLKAQLHHQVVAGMDLSLILSRRLAASKHAGRVPDGKG